MRNGDDAPFSTFLLVGLLFLAVGVSRLVDARALTKAQPREQITVGTICADPGGQYSRRCYTFAVDGKRHFGYFYPFLEEEFHDGLIQGHQITVYFDRDDPAQSSPLEFGARSANYYRDSTKDLGWACLCLVLARVFR
jgi:hypothetical protein